MSKLFESKEEGICITAAYEVHRLVRKECNLPHWDQCAINLQKRFIETCREILYKGECYTEMYDETLVKVLKGLSSALGIIPAAEEVASDPPPPE